jgi:hypothetical protein
MKIYISNAFSLQMIPDGGIIDVNKITIERVHGILKIVNNDEVEGVIGHEDTANVVNAILGIDLPHARKSIVLDEESLLIVAQVTGGRLPVGCNKLPEDCKLEFYLVEFNTY